MSDETKSMEHYYSMKEKEKRKSSVGRKREGRKNEVNASREGLALRS